MPHTVRSLFSSRVLVAEQPVCRLVFLDRWKSSDWLIKAVVILIIITHGNFSEQNISRTFLYMKIMIEIRLDCDTFSRYQSHTCSRRNSIGSSVTVYGHISVCKPSVLCRIIYCNQ